MLIALNGQFRRPRDTFTTNVIKFNSIDFNGAEPAYASSIFGSRV